MNSQEDLMVNWLDFDLVYYSKKLEVGESEEGVGRWEMSVGENSRRYKGYLIDTLKDITWL